jgi:hypothetical protein
MMVGPGCLAGDVKPGSGCGLGNKSATILLFYNYSLLLLTSGVPGCWSWISDES